MYLIFAVFIPELAPYKKGMQKIQSSSFDKARYPNPTP